MEILERFRAHNITHHIHREDDHSPHRRPPDLRPTILTDMGECDVNKIHGISNLKIQHPDINDD